jgi:hypothetical protein
MEYNRAIPVLENYPNGWPPKKYYVGQNKVTRKQFEEFKALIHKESGETEIDKFLKENLEVFSIALDFFKTGHHGAWIIPQQDIKPQTSDPGLKPDYIIGGKSSDGFGWWVLDLKGANEKIFSEKENRICFSNKTNMGIFQVLEYINYCAKMQSYMREVLSLNGFREPKGLLIIGRESEMEENNRKQELKAAWNRLSDKLQVRTYDAFLRAVEEQVVWNENQD